MIGGCTAVHPLPVSREPIQLERIPLSYHSGRAWTTFSVAVNDWATLRELFESTGDDPRRERLAIRHAVAYLERIAGSQTSTYRDLGRNRINPLGDGHMDCLDESANTTTYLRLFEERRLLLWHEVMRRVHRGPLHLDTHNSALIRDRTDGSLYVVDSWHLDNGERPYIQPLDSWFRKAPLPETTP